MFKKLLLLITGSIVMIPSLLQALPPLKSQNKIEANTYALTTDGHTRSQCPIVLTKKGAITAAHCVKDLPTRAITPLKALGPDNHMRQFTIDKLVYEHGKRDFALLEGKGGDIPIGDTSLLRKGDAVSIYSHKLGWTEHKIEVMPDPRYDLTRFYISGYPELKGASGSGVYNEAGELVGIFFALTTGNRGVVQQIQEVYK